MRNDVLCAAEHADTVVVDDQAEVVQPVVRRKHHRLPVGALVQLAVATDDEDAAHAPLALQREGNAGCDAQAVPKRTIHGFVARYHRIRNAAEEAAAAYLTGRTLADEIAALAALTVDDANELRRTALREENRAYVQIDPAE